MNTPTPAQALGEVIEAATAAMTTADCDEAADMAMRFIQDHGQHFAGLAERYEAVVLLGREAVEQFDAMRSRAEAAEARCAELGRECETLNAEVDRLNERNKELCEQTLAANARVRELEREVERWHNAYEIAHDQAMANGTAAKRLEAQCKPQPISEVELIVGERDDVVLTISTTVGDVRRFAAFLAARG